MSTGHTVDCRALISMRCKRNPLEDMSQDSDSGDERPLYVVDQHVHRGSRDKISFLNCRKTSSDRQIEWWDDHLSVVSLLLVTS
jgi:hypothetical protein